MTFSVYIPGTEEKDPSKLVMSLRAIAEQLGTAQTDIDALQAQTTSYESAWTTYTPTITSQTGSFTTVSATGRYKQNGKTVFVEIDVTITTAGTAAGYLKATLPVTSASYYYVGSAFEYNSGGSKSGACIIAPGLSTTACVSRYADGLTMIATGNSVAISLTYEAA